MAKLVICFLIYFLLTDQRNLGMSMRVERSSLDQVKKRFEVNKKKIEEKQTEYDFEERMKELREEVGDGARILSAQMDVMCVISSGQEINTIAVMSNVSIMTIKPC